MLKTKLQPLTEEQIVKGILEQEDRAFDALVRQFHTPMKQFAMTMLDEFTAEEITQDALIAAVQKMASFEGRASLKTWLLSITGNLARTKLRKAKREVSLEGLSQDNTFLEEAFKENGHWGTTPFTWQDNSPEALMSFDEFKKCLDNTMNKLPDIQKSVVVLKDYLGMSSQEVCEILAISDANIRVLTHRSRQKIYSMIDHFEQTGEC